METKQKLKIALVGYTNTLPMQNGMKNEAFSSHFEVQMLNPADCVNAYQKNDVDIALVPVGALTELEDYQVITDICIACDGEVNSVALFSDEPIESIKTIILDSHSRTSNNLVKILMKKWWKKNVEYSKSDVDISAPGLHSNQGVILIGDKVFRHQHLYKYKYDLGRAWKELTGKPFVFAVWIARNVVDKNSKQLLNEALQKGIENIDEVLKTIEKNSMVDYDQYLNRNIHYKLTKDAREGMELFISYMKKENALVDKEPNFAGEI